MVVMEALADLGDRLEFVYTDISPQLVAYGRKTYGAAYPFATFRLLDVERHIEAQVRGLIKNRRQFEENPDRQEIARLETIEMPKRTASLVELC